MDTMNMGAIAVLAGCVIICAGIAKVSPLDVVKYSSVAMLTAIVVAVALLMML